MDGVKQIKKIATSRKNRTHPEVPRRKCMMIRDLPKRMAKYLHPSLRNILTCRPKRWNHGSPTFRLAVNLINRYRRPIKPRVLPFYCDRCLLSTRKLEMIMHHVCEKEEKKKTTNGKRNAPYDFSKDVKIAQNAFKSIKQNSLAIMEKTPRPQHVKLPRFEKVDKEMDVVQVIPKVPRLFELCHIALAIEDDMEGVPIDVIMENVPCENKKNERCEEEKCSSSTEPSSRHCLNHPGSATFCFRCRELFNNFSDYSEHMEDSECGKALPEYHGIDVDDRLGTINKQFCYRNYRHKKVKRDVSHIRCTLCQAGNFESTDQLYSHMFKCLEQQSNAYS